MVVLGEGQQRLFDVLPESAVDLTRRESRTIEQNLHLDGKRTEAVSGGHLAGEVDGVDAVGIDLSSKRGKRNTRHQSESDDPLGHLSSAPSSSPALSLERTKTRPPGSPGSGVPQRFTALVTTAQHAAPVISLRARHCARRGRAFALIRSRLARRY